VPTLRIVEDLCDDFGVTCTITSSYRNPEYNAKVGGKPNSLHMTFKALDISFPGIAASTVYAKLVKWRANGKFTGGLGSYPGFTHIDTRNYNTNW
jgi:N-acetylmuramoyl-L-alanine amidase